MPSYDTQTGCLVWDTVAQRPDIRYLDGTRYGGLHCGDTLEVLIRNRWIATRIEYSHDAGQWYLVGMGIRYEFQGLSVRKR